MKIARKIDRWIMYIVILFFVVTLLGCTTTTEWIRSYYTKISKMSTEQNIEKFKQSSFMNFFRYKTTLQGDFNLYHFLSYYFHVRSQYSSTTISVYSTYLFQVNKFFTFGSVFNSSIQRKDNTTKIMAYSILDEKIVSKQSSVELVIREKDIKPGRLRGTISNPSATLTLKKADGTILFDISDEKSFVLVDIVSIDNNIVYGKLQGMLAGPDKNIHLNILEGEFWLKL